MRGNVIAVPAQKRVSRATGNASAEGRLEPRVRCIAPKRRGGTAITACSVVLTKLLGELGPNIALAGECVFMSIILYDALRPLGPT